MMKKVRKGLLFNVEGGEEFLHYRIGSELNLFIYDVRVSGPEIIFKFHF